MNAVGVAEYTYSRLLNGLPRMYVLYGNASPVNLLVRPLLVAVRMVLMHSYARSPAFRHRHHVEPRRVMRLRPSQGQDAFQ